eukprot:gene10659-biopygen6297
MVIRSGRSPLPPLAVAATARARPATAAWRDGADRRALATAAPA